MLVENFNTTYPQYENLEVWDVATMNDFFEGNTVIPIIFKQEYRMHLKDFEAKRAEIEETDRQIMDKILDKIGDKHFFIFTLHDANHLELVSLQNMKVINFGVDIEDIKEDHVYIMIMTKKATNSGSPSMN